MHELTSTINSLSSVVGAWTILLCGRQYHKWGFYVNNHKWRPLRYFSKFGIIQDENYQ